MLFLYAMYICVVGSNTRLCRYFQVEIEFFSLNRSKCNLVITGKAVGNVFLWF